MSKKKLVRVLNIDHTLDNVDIEVLLDENPNIRYVHYTHEKQLKRGDNLITEARENIKSYNLLIMLAQRGFYLYMTKEGRRSSFVHHYDLPKLWKPLVNNEYTMTDSGLVYQIENSTAEQIDSLLVIFSSVNSPMYQSSLMRMFSKNYKSMSKFIPENTAILRIADLGGVVGSYYMNSKYLPNNESNILQLISNIKIDLQVSRVCLLGGSKGGSAAVLYSLLGDYDCVAVDPILTDMHYKGDSHFTINLLEQAKHEKFAKILLEKKWDKHCQRYIISALNSPQLPHITNTLNDYSGKFTMFLNKNTEIKTHPDVMPFSIHMTTSLVNMVLNDIGVFDEKYNFY